MTRHKAHDIIVPDFAPLPDLTQYKEVSAIKKNCQEEYDDIFAKNIKMVEKFKVEDLVYFVLSGNMVNIMTNIKEEVLHVMPQH